MEKDTVSPGSPRRNLSPAMSFRRRTSESIAELQRQLEALKTARSAIPPPPQPSDASLAPPSPGTSLAEVHDFVRSLSERVDGLDHRQIQDHERLSLRLEELTTQFSNQLLEIGGELDSAHQHLTSQLTAQEQRFEALAAAHAAGNGDGAPAPELIEELRSNQIRIANDLARHEIAVRQDLAALAELVNRSRTTR
jgi:hypothetical protein